ncbi:putative DNA-invertase from lambdoid prophage Rac [Palleronia aestuarii]|uniref:Putative DNA-invertase from lambdoid prophage Rac n=1 Tax=Palleronia aestuarii TaxID=568105 RepID=A0A2W7MZH1_9RHOB|nr:recombinase family protein [Palleronia aestuarii]PZX12983.1 putative DNA-invertase from lambdoid prophage Rac [Palleronia aestuarii]
MIGGFRAAVPRTFAYLRVSTAGQTTETQKQQIAAAGIAVEEYRVMAETVSGSVEAIKRPGFARLVDRLEPGDMLVVTKMDRLGRNAMDVMATIARLGEMSVRVRSLDLGEADLTSAAGRMTTNILNVVAQFERELPIERARAGIDRARAQGKRLGRPPALDPERRAEIAAGLRKGEAISDLARRFGTSRMTVQRIRDGYGKVNARTKET